MVAEGSVATSGCQSRSLLGDRVSHHVSTSANTDKKQDIFLMFLRGSMTLPSANNPRDPTATQRRSAEKLEKTIAIVPQHVMARNMSQAETCLILTVCFAVPSGPTFFFPFPDRR